MGKRKSSEPARMTSRQRARLEPTQMSLGESSSMVSDLPSRDTVGDRIAPEQRSLEDVTAATDRRDGDVLASPETLTASEDFVLPGQPVETQKAELEQLKESDFYVSLNVCKTQHGTADHLNLGRLPLHPKFPSQAFCIALNEDSRWSTEVWLYVHESGTCTLYAEMKTQSNRKRKRTNCLVEQLPGLMKREALSLLTAINEQPDGKQLVKLMWQRPAIAADALAADGGDSRKSANEGIVAAVLVSVQAFVDMSSAARMLLSSQRKAIQMALNHFFSSLRPQQQRAEDSHDEHYLAQTLKLYRAVAAYNAQLCMDGTIAEANDACRERGLLPTLRMYQWRAVRWMLGRENAPGWGDRKSPESGSSNGDDRSVITDQSSSHNYRLYDFAASFQRLDDVNGVGFYVHTASGALSGTLPSAVDLPLGGVLADEMGLGKTLEVLGCILFHPRPSLPDKVSMLKIANGGTDANIDVPAADVCGQSTVEGIPARLSASPLEQQSFWECSCWQQDGSSDNKQRVRCVRCGVIQHAECMAYDLAVYKEPYLCPYCLLDVEPIQSKTTLIVVPESIAHQWLSEITRHVKPGTLKFTMYYGASSQKYTQPLTLCSYDVVITTYEILCKELRFTNLRHTTGLEERRLGKPKRFTAMPSPLKAIQWWRICLDEAQMVESTTTKTAEMALMLHAVNRWCVTGTPVQHSLQDLYGLMLFLGVKPFYVRQLWQLLLFEPHTQGLSEELYDVVSRIMWRSSKVDVADELNIPPVTYTYDYLNFTPVEDFFYRHLSTDCKRSFKLAIQKISDKTVQPNSLEKLVREKVMDPLRQLLHACCHPQAVRNFFMHGQENTLTMEEVARKLVKNTVTDCEELHRLTVSHQLGLAALYILKDKPEDAERTYRSVLKSAEVHLAKEVRTDDLQLLHTVYNLRSLLQKTAADVSPDVPSTSAAAAACDASFDSLGEQQTLLQKEHEIRNRYSSNSMDAVKRFREEWHSAREPVVQLTEQLSSNPDWWAAAIKRCVKFGCDNELVEEVHGALRRSTAHILGYGGAASRFDDVSAMILVVKLYLGRFSETYGEVIRCLSLLNKLEPGTPEFGNLMRTTIRCCLRPEGTTPRCPFCLASRYLAAYECKVFSFRDQNILECSKNWSKYYHTTTIDNPVDESIVDFAKQGAWKPSESEVLMNSIIGFCRKRTRKIGVLAAADLKASEIHEKLFRAWRAEFKPLRALWVALYERVRTFDELEMAIERIQLRPDPVDETSNSGNQEGTRSRNVFASQVPTMIETALADLRKDDQRLSTKMRHLLYLRHFVEDSKKQELEPCCICFNDLSREGWTVLLCGHYGCFGCIVTACSVATTDALSRGADYRDIASLVSQKLRCPICREATPISQLTTVRATNSRSDQDASEVDVLGDLSSKMRAIVRCVKDIINKDQTTKIIVISECLNVLWRVQDALKTNNIEYVALNSHAGALQKESILTTFKTGTVNVLLLPIIYGSAGLNLVEATHIIFPTPILNPAQEFQAIGRIHRIGQTRPTFVHYFIMKDTIEDKLHAAVKKSVEQSVGSYQFAAADDVPLTLEDILKIVDPREQH